MSALARELEAHATADERHFSVPLVMVHAGLHVAPHRSTDFGAIVAQVRRI